MKKAKAIGILGGMGPEASGYLYKLLIEKAVSDFGAKQNNDFPEIVLHSIPVPDFISSNIKQKEALRMLKKRVQQLNYIDLSCLSIACNTAHVLLPHLQKVSKVPFISMLEEVVREVKQDTLQTVGLLGTPSTIQYGLYQTLLKENGIATVVPTKKQIKALEKIIRNVLHNKTQKENSKRLKEIANSLKEKGAHGIILGCTELPLVFPTKYSLPIYNSLDILANALLRKYYINS